MSTATKKRELAAKNINLTLINLNGRLSLDMCRELRVESVRQEHVCGKRDTDPGHPQSWRRSPLYCEKRLPYVLVPSAAL